MYYLLKKLFYDLYFGKTENLKLNLIKMIFYYPIMKYYYLYNLINTKVFDGIKFVIFANQNNLGAKKLSQKLSKNQVRFIYFTSLNSFTPKNIFSKILIILLKPILFLISIFQFYLILKNYKFEVFMGQCGGYGDFRSEMAAMFIAKIIKFPAMVLVIHHACGKPIFWNTLLNISNNLLSKIVTSVISVSKATRDSVFYKSNLLDRSSDLKDLVIYNGVPINQKISDEGLIKNVIYKDSREPFLLGMVSRVEAYKGQTDLIEGFSKLSENIKKKLKVYIIGSGKKTEIEKIKKLINEKNLENYFVITGYVDYDSILILSKLDLLISLTKTFEGFGLSITEAMSIGTPVLATKVGAITEYLNKENSTLIEASNINQISNALYDFVVNKEQWNRRADVGKNTIIKNFTSEIMAKNYLKHFEESLL